jgi:phage terminase large subunit-like protein
VPPGGGDTPSYTGVQRAIDYAEAVRADAIDVCQFVHLACDRFISDLAEARRGGGEWAFREGPAEAKILLAEMLPNIKGPSAGKPLRLAGWQCFVYANLFGFYERGTDARRFRQGVIYVPRGNGKTTFAAPIVLGMTFCEEEGGAEGYAAAVTRDQARILFDTANQMVVRSEAFRQAFGVRAMVNSIYQESTASKMVPVSSDAKALDGLNVHCAVCDEIGSHKTSEVYDVLLTAMGKRSNPMLLCISTATGNTSGIGKVLWDYTVKVLNGALQDERLFGLIYTIDDGDDPWDEKTWIKANPNWGISVQPTAVRAIMRQARNNPAQEAVAMTRHLNIWVGADEALFSMRAWIGQTNRDLRLNSFEGRECHIAIDLASKTDLASCAITFPTTDYVTGRMTYVTFQQSFLNETAVLEARNASYPGWANEGYLKVTEGNETDFEAIEDWLLQCCDGFRVLSVAYDPWAATQFAQRMTARNVPMFEFRATTQNFSEPTKELDAAIRAARIEHDGDPVLAWGIGNVVGRYDARSNVYPRKSREENKIDPAIALIMTIARCMDASGPVSSYNDPRTRQSIAL